MGYSIKKAAILGAGTMGAAIAAHLVGAGIPVYLLDIVPRELTEAENAAGLSLDSPQVRNRFAQAGKDRVGNPKMKAIYDPDLASMIEIGNFEDDLHLVAEVDWIIEAIVENLDVKKKLMDKISQYRKPGTIVSSNTSGVSINKMVEDLPLEFRQHFLGTHFFNPPRFMKLLEIIPSNECLPELVEFMKEFGIKRLGKGVVVAKDTPNFIANRIGVYGIMTVVKAMEEYGYSVPEADRITGPVMGRPKSATFRTLDLVGIDVFYNVIVNVYDILTDVKEKEEFAPIPLIKEMVDNKWLGDKTKQGFYKKVKSEKGKDTFFWDYLQKEYVNTKTINTQLPTVDKANKEKKLANKLQTLVYGEEKDSKFAWDVLKKTLLYSASKVPEIADDYKDIDKALVWGFNWELGPFATWDAIGLEKSVERMKEEGEVIPAWVEKMLASGQKRFYEDKAEVKPYIVLSSLKNRVVKENEDASLIDLGDGIACLNFHSKSNSITNKVIEMIKASVEEVEDNFLGLVIGNQSKNFCVGANLALVGQYARDKNWKALEDLVDNFQNANMALKYCSKPVVTAPYRMTLGGGAEVTMHAHQVITYAETYLGLVEVGVGLIPAGGGVKEMLLRSTQELGKLSQADLLPSLQKAWETICMAKVSGSGLEAIKLGYLKKSDRVVMSEEYLIDSAKRAALGLAESGFRTLQKENVRVLGTTGRASLENIVHNMSDAGYLTQYDAYLAKQIAKVITGGDVPGGIYVTEEYILGLEKEVFISLCGEEKTQQRIEYMLTKGKALRN